MILNFLQKISETDFHDFMQVVEVDLPEWQGK